MNTESRTLNAKKNIITAFLSKILILILVFVCRKVFIVYIGVAYLGINGLFANILTLLSMADLGLATAMNVRLYKPLAEGDKDKLASILNYFKKIYWIIALAVLVIGLCLTPFLKYIVNMDSEIPHLYLYYVIFVLKSVCSYLFVYKQSIINADQHRYIVNFIEMFTNIAISILKIVFIIVFRSFLLYILLDVAQVIIHNVIISVVANKQYPFIKQKNKLDKNEKKSIFSDVRSAFVYKVSRSMISGTDNIIISIIIGTIIVGVYSNYSTIVGLVEEFIALFFASLTAGIGNLVAKESPFKRFQVFKRVQVLGFFLCTFCSMCLLFLSQDFISIFFGEDLLLDSFTLFTIVLCFYVNISFRPMIIFREGTGMYFKIKYAVLVAAILNIGLSIFLGKLIGLPGIFLATFIAKVTTYFWLEPKLLYRDTFERSSKSYFSSHGQNLIITIVCFVIIFAFTNKMPSSSIIFMFVKLFVCMLVCGTAYYFYYRNSEEYNYFKDLLKSRFNSLQTKFKKKGIK